MELIIDGLCRQPFSLNHPFFKSFKETYYITNEISDIDFIPWSYKNIVTASSKISDIVYTLARDLCLKNFIVYTEDKSIVDYLSYNPSGVWLTHSLESYDTYTLQDLSFVVSSEPCETEYTTHVFKKSYDLPFKMKVGA